MKKLIFALICLSLAIPCGANPIPVPPPASMPLEDMHIVIQPCGDTLHATFTGDFTFDYIPIDVLFMLFPVPPDANNIRVWQDNVELPWTWSGQMYPTILPEMPTIPMIEWLGPFPTNGAVFRVDYEHDLIKRPEEFIFFYASGTGKYFETYDKTTTAYFDILLPAGFAVAGVWLDYTAHEYEVIDGHLNITVQSYFGPITNDLIVSLVQTPIYVATDGNDTTGDGSPENPFATIQKGIDEALDGDTVIVQPGVYLETINFLGKNITVTSTNPSDSKIVRDTVIEGSSNPYYLAVIFTGTENKSCALMGFNIREKVVGNHAQATISNCLLEGTRTLCGTLIYGFDGRILNCLIGPPMIMAQCFFPEYTISGCHGIIENCTIIGSILIGSDASAIIQNCILYNDSVLSKPIKLLSGASVNISYTNFYKSTDPIELKDSNCVVNWGPGNINLDPYFAQLGIWDFNEPVTYYPGDFHLKSTAGRWDPNSESWVTDGVTSPCIDRGNPGCPLGDEPNDANNIRINMGAYGGTAEASKLPSGGLLDYIIADLTNSWVISKHDLEVFVSYWLESGECIPSDLNRSKSVDFVDYAIFAQHWYYPPPPRGAGIEYEITPCGMGSSAAEQSGETRFTVTIQGRYILFEDMMVANCCPEELGLEMTVEDNLITIYETEYTPGGCWCICDYPITATLGPFEPGTYTLEVYEDWGGFIGSTIVYIE